MKRLLFEIYWLIFKFEFFFSQPPVSILRQLFYGNGEEERRQYYYYRAQKLSPMFPWEAKEILDSLLSEIYSYGSPEAQQQLSAKTHFQMATVTDNPSEKEFHLRKCFELDADFHVDPQVLSELRRQAKL